MFKCAAARFLVASIISACLTAGPAAAQQWPRLRSSEDSAICNKALEAAKAIFASPQPGIYLTDSFPNQLGLDVLIKPQPDNPVGVFGLIEDERAFERMALQGATDRYNLFWSRTPSFGKRLVLSEEYFNWQGNWFELHAVAADVSPEELLADIEKMSSNRRFPPLLDNEWRAPLVVRDRASSDIWVIAVGHPADFLRDWRVFSIGADDAKERCIIQFAPDIAPPGRVGKAWDLLPEDTRQLAKLLDSTLGTGMNEGTLNPTQRNRNEAGHGWANAALRPWVFAGKDTSQARASVTNLLTHWSRKARSFARHYDLILTQYPLAEAALAKHYRTTFNMPEREAAATAAAAINISAGCYFSLISCH